MPAQNELLFSKTRLEKTVELTQDAYLFSFEKKFSFTPGQCVAIKYELSEDYRIYSIAGGVDEPYLEVLFDVNPEGLLTPRLSRLQPGKHLYLSNPFGNFFTPSGEAWWIAAGTGIAPFLSMAASGLAANKTLIHGASYENGLYFAGTLELLIPRYIRCCSRENIGGCYYGRVTQWLKEQPVLPAEIPYMVCGSAEFVIDVRDVLLEKGVRYDKIIAEIYF